jgi:23S rRNA (pseudouridine1915-N3)-methyltransferase
MKLSLFCIAIQKSGAEAQTLATLLQHYQKQMSPNLDIKDFFVKQKLPPEQLRRKESELLLDNLPPQAYLIALDERGENPTSLELAKKIEKIQLSGLPHLVLAIGGAHGHDELLRKRADYVLSFGKMTWPHQLMKLLVTEQLYRAQMILKGHPYHKE